MTKLTTYLILIIIAATIGIAVGMIMQENELEEDCNLLGGTLEGIYNSCAGEGCPTVIRYCLMPDGSKVNVQEFYATINTTVI